ncbi:MAG: ATP-dependent zinc metalloprotease FtsH [Spirochaetes bacterium]|uniref:ATP-dependent zinc metalloprotease FtsH n=1 Tax=Candidatus Gallitreponema excrementavium TaxID=2840840 RepID=A0A9D9HQ79_9SPIR|nr:ATP-dependent zinc metalloprotease FtsH [Candidatus Gallitreponema excrementavium]
MSEKKIDNNLHGGPSVGGRISKFIFILAVLLVLWYLFFFNKTDYRDISYSEFKSYIESGLVSEVMIQDEKDLFGTIVTDPENGAYETIHTIIPYTDSELVKSLEERNIIVYGSESKTPFWIYLLEFLPVIFMFLILLMIFRQSQGQGNKAFQFGKSRARLYLGGKKVTFDDVAGLKESKYELEEIVDYLKKPDKYIKMGARIPKGILLVGMPGTGKTLLARAVAGEAGVPFFHISGSDFVEMFVGVGASRVRDLFMDARKNAPCIVFIDELDAVGRARGAGFGGGHDEREQTLNQMLVEMDGFDSKEGIIILAATNRPDVLDPALLRPGRFDRQVVVAMPDIKEREAILRIHGKKMPVDESVDYSHFAKATPGMSGADLANMMNEAALAAARKNLPGITKELIEEARDKVLMGVARTSVVIPKDELKLTAVHESGHALLHYFLENADPLHKVTIIPRGRALGVAFSLPEHDSFSRKKAWVEDRLVICYGGFAAETIVYGETTTGTKADIKSATELARHMVCDWGMSDEVGPVAYGKNDEPVFLGKEMFHADTVSEKISGLIDETVASILEKSKDKAVKILTENRDKLDILSAALLERETLDDGDIRLLLNFPPREITE